MCLVVVLIHDLNQGTTSMKIFAHQAKIVNSDKLNFLWISLKSRGIPNNYLLLSKYELSRC